MKRAFDDNVSRAKPRLRLSQAFAGVEEAATPEDAALVPPAPREEASPLATLAPPSDEGVPGEVVASAIAQRIALEEVRIDAPAAMEPPLPAPPEPRAKAKAEAPRAAPAPKHASRPAKAPPIAQPPEAPAPAGEPTALRRERLKERLRRASQPLNLREPTPASSAEAEASSLAIIGQLQQALEAAESRGAALERDLESARSQLSRAAAEAKENQAQAQSLAAEAGERSALLEDLTAELAAVESERDDSLLQLSRMRAERDAETARRTELEAALTSKEKELLEAISEEERFAADLEQRTEEVRGLRALAASLTTERDALLQQLTQLNREREELGEARKALESVHRALSDARTRSVARR